MKPRSRTIILIICILLTVVLGSYLLFKDNIRTQFFKPTGSDLRNQEVTDTARKQIGTIISKLDTPWSIVVLPNDQILVSERQGTVTLLNERIGQQIADVVENGEGGLLGITLHPDFATNQYIYVYKTTGQSNVVERYQLANNRLVDQKKILDGIPFASNHNGGDIKFGPDKKLYITTGDAGEQSSAQNLDSLSGKILRLNDDGTIPADNPYKTEVWSYGHRNPQGITWDDQKRLWSTEHGPSGTQSGEDELNLITKGGNYGWPLVSGDQTGNDLILPVAHSGKNETWAPGGITYSNNALYFTGLRGQTIYKAKINGETVKLSRHFSEEYGRLRAITVRGNDLLVSTSNRDGRGNPTSEDDRILQIPINLF